MAIELEKKLYATDGYREAARFDEQIHAALSMNPIRKSTARFWLAYARTIRTTCELIEKRAAAAMED